MTHSPAPEGVMLGAGVFLVRTAPGHCRGPEPSLMLNEPGPVHSVHSTSGPGPVHSVCMEPRSHSTASLPAVPAVKPQSRCLMPLALQGLGGGQVCGSFCLSPSMNPPTYGTSTPHSPCTLPTSPSTLNTPQHLPLLLIGPDNPLHS
uniref:Uncharacterized protein n=1 Tax=Crocodylus porosus TaxID=8502 RepID=A0A7M4FRK5_CROPO